MHRLGQPCVAAHPFRTSNLQARSIASAFPVRSAGIGASEAAGGLRSVSLQFST
jgi:hypothetical protein